ncbi:hypothetical protein NKI44_18815 [Mesorhizobium sp. M0614]|uniref:hypothetical protein n=1 Tax=Mesorhizobium sp. M0614 TaxID=2956970 RepID=UPI00333ABCCE
MLQLLLNDLSIPNDACSREVAIARLKQFVDAVRTVSSISPQFILNGPHSLAELSFATNWSLAALRNDGGCTDENIYLKTVQDRFPYGQTIAELDGPPLEGLEYRMADNAAICVGKPALGLGLAHQFNGLALSLSSHAFWSESGVDLYRLSLEEGGDIREEMVTARNACSNEGVAHHRDALMLLTNPKIVDGAQLWAERELLFPNLRFIPRTRQQIEELNHGDPILDPIVERLLGLDRAIGAWRRNQSAHPAFPFSVNGESRRRRALAAFADENGTILSFEDHAKFTPGEGRLHFLLQTEPERRALIGHVGRKVGIG